MRFHPKALFVTGATIATVWLALNTQLGAVAILALIVVDVFSFLAPAGFFHSDRRAKTE